MKKVFVKENSGHGLRQYNQKVAWVSPDLTLVENIKVSLEPSQWLPISRDKTSVKMYVKLSH